MKVIIRRITEEFIYANSAVTSIEYGLIAALIAILIIAAVTAVGLGMIDADSLPAISAALK
jgi:Flp pilus assembly pilin Flp